MKKAMRGLLILLCAVLAFVTVVFLVYRWREEEVGNNQKPVIECPSDSLRLDVDQLSNKSALLSGVVATDAEDGDITKNLVVESVSQFVGDRHCIITYAVFDSNNNVTKATRHLYLVNYTSPRFKITAPLEFSFSTNFNPLGCVEAYDCIDGDITNKIKINMMNADDSIASVGAHMVEFSVTNSLGDTQRLQAEVVVYDRTYTELRGIPSIALSDYLIYIDPNTQGFDPLQYVTGITINGVKYSVDEYPHGELLVDDGGLKKSQLVSGDVYRVLFTCTNGDYVGSAVLIVVIVGGNGGNG